MTEQPKVSECIWETRYLSPAGFECRLELRGGDAAELLKVAGGLLSRMVDAGAKPVVEVAQASPVAVATMPAAAAPVAGGTPPVCPIHGTPMKVGKHGWFCPTKIAENDGSGRPVYCKATA